MSASQRIARWRLILGGDAESGGMAGSLSPHHQSLDMALGALYDDDDQKKGADLSGSSPRVTR